MSIIGSPAAYAASRATLPALSPWRTIQSVSGQRCSMVRSRGQGAYHGAIGLSPTKEACAEERKRRSGPAPPALQYFHSCAPIRPPLPRRRAPRACGALCAERAGLSRHHRSHHRRGDEGQRRVESRRRADRHLRPPHQRLRRARAHHRLGAREDEGRRARERARRAGDGAALGARRRVGGRCSRRAQAAHDARTRRKRRHASGRHHGAGARRLAASTS